MMVDKTDLPKINALITELTSINQAIHNVEATPTRGSITSMVIGAPPGDTAAVPAQVITTDMPTPPAMYDAIAALLVQRQSEINTELTAMGVTVGPTPQAASSHPKSKR